MLAYYKYANFFLSSVNHIAGSTLSLGEIVLPLGISFFTFTQIAFLADAYYGKAREYSFVHYGLFVTYFPHLIAGPVLHHAEMMPQFAERATYRFSFENAAVGITIFVIGLFKKVMLADGIGGYAKPVFDAAAAGVELTALEAWCGALAYTFQLYFDFSGYSDMAIGLSRLFGDRAAAQFSFAVQSRQHHRILAALAYDVVAFSARLSLYSAGRQPPGTGAALREPDDHHGIGRVVAWRGLDLRAVGRVARRLSRDQSRLARAARRVGARPRALDALGTCVRLRD